MIQQKHRIILHLIHFQDDANHVVLVLRHAHSLQKTARFDVDRLIEQGAIQVRAVEIEIDSIWAGNARGLVFYRRANINHDARVSIRIPGADARHFGDLGI